jgi:DTW domain-containing protein YfiP
MSRRENADQRCVHCHLHQLICICAQLPRILTRTRLVVLLHGREADKPTNTGALAALCLPNAVVRAPPAATDRRLSPATRAPHRADDADGADDADDAKASDAIRDARRTAPFDVGADAALLFPSVNARTLAGGASARIATLVVPDGTWRQARKMARDLDRSPDAAAWPRVALPEGLPPTQYRLRNERREGGLSTLEAIAHALAILDGDPTIATRLLAAQRMFVERTLWVRGALRDDQVTDGLPPGAGVVRGTHPLAVPLPRP